MYSTKETKKKRHKKNLKNLWNQFDTENGTTKPPDSTSDPSAIECVYSQNKTRDNCDACGEPVKQMENGYLTCTNTKCAIIYKDVLDHGAEWRYYGSSDNNGTDPTRCGMPINPLLEQSSYGCKISCASRSSYEMKKIKRYTEWQSMPYKEKAHYDEFQRIKIMANNSGIPKIIIDDALIYHKKISEQKTFRALNRDGIIAASIYISCRINDFPRTAKEIAVIFHLDTTSATKGCKNAVTILNKLEKDVEGNDKTVLCNTKPIAFIQRYCSKLNINQELTKLGEFIAMMIDKYHLIPENTPHSVAAGIVYFIAQTCNLNVSKHEIRAVSEISEVTINKCFKKLESMQDKLIPSAIRQKYCQ